MHGCVRQTAARIRDVLEAINLNTTASQSESPSDIVGPAVTTAAVKNCLQMMEYHEIPRLRFGQEEAFQELWPLGIPIVVDVQDRFTGIWSPAILKQLYSNEQVTMVTVDTNGETSESVKLSVFFDRFEAAAKQTKWAVKMKVRAT